jgi:hypothetical protein
VNSTFSEVRKDELFSSITSHKYNQFQKKTVFVMPTATLNEENLTQYREALETKLGITDKQFEITEAFVHPWYPSGDKNRRYKLGSLSLC